ncbi:hypothetical protein MRX96_021231 [Rhipicephalus microplus]
MEWRVVRRVSPVTYLVETRSTVRQVHVDHLRSRTFYQYAGSNIATEALETTLYRGLSSASLGSYHAPVMVFPPPTWEQKWPLPVANDELPRRWQKSLLILHQLVVGFHLKYYPRAMQVN